MLMCARNQVRDTPNIVAIGVPDQRSLDRVKAKLHNAGVGYVCWEEPDYDLGFTAICTQPLTREEKQFLANYRLWQPSFRGSSENRATAPQEREALVQIQPPEPCSSSSTGQSNGF